MKLNQNQELEMTFKNVLACLIFFGALIPLGFVNANTLCDDFKSQKEPTGFILKNNILNLFTSMDVLDKPGTFKSKETNLKKIYYVNLKKYIKQTYGYNNFRLETKSVTLKTYQCNHLKFIAFSVPLETMKIFKIEGANNVNLENIEISNMNEISFLDSQDSYFNEFK